MVFHKVFPPAPTLYRDSPHACFLRSLTKGIKYPIHIRQTVIIKDNNEPASIFFIGTENRHNIVKLAESIMTENGLKWINYPQQKDKNFRRARRIYIRGVVTIILIVNTLLNAKMLMKFKLLN